MKVIYCGFTYDLNRDKEIKPRSQSRIQKSVLTTPLYTEDTRMK